MRKELRTNETKTGIKVRGVGRVDVDILKR